MEIRGKAMPEIVKTVWKEETDRLSRTGIGQDELQDETAEAFIRKAEKLCEKTVTYENRQYADRDRLLDRLFTSRYTGFPIMFLLLLLVLLKLAFLHLFLLKINRLFLVFLIILPF